MNNNNGISKLAKYGLSGVAIASILLSGFIVNKAFDLMGNHLQESIKTQQALIDVVEDLDDSVIKLMDYLIYQSPGATEEGH